MKLTLNRILIFVGAISIFAIYAIHLFLIINGKPSFMPENLRDIVITTTGVLLSSSYIYLFIRNKKPEYLFLIFANMFLIISMIHFLRLLFGGLPC
jgi:hypothetical protein